MSLPHSFPAHYCALSLSLPTDSLLEIYNLFYLITICTTQLCMNLELNPISSNGDISNYNPLYYPFLYISATRLVFINSSRRTGPDQKDLHNPCAAQCKTLHFPYSHPLVRIFSEIPLLPCYCRCRVTGFWCRKPRNPLIRHRFPRFLRQTIGF